MVHDNQQDLQGMVDRTAAAILEYLGDREEQCTACEESAWFEDCDKCEGRRFVEIEGSDPLEVKWEYSQAGAKLYLTKITLVTGTGGPHIEIVLAAGGRNAYAVGYWGGCEPARSYITGDDGERVFDHLAELDPVALGVSVER